MSDREEEIDVNSKGVIFEKEKEAENAVLDALDGVYGYDLSKCRLNATGNVDELKKGLAMVMDSLVKLAEVAGQRKVLRGNYQGVPERGMKVELLRNAADTLNGKRGSYESLIGIMPTISGLARDFVRESHMYDLGMPDNQLGRIFYRLQFPGGDERAKLQIEQIVKVENCVVANASRWAEENRIKRL